MLFPENDGNQPGNSMTKMYEINADKTIDQKKFSFSPKIVTLQDMCPRNEKWYKISAIE